MEMLLASSVTSEILSPSKACWDARDPGGITRHPGHPFMNAYMIDQGMLAGVVVFMPQSSTEIAVEASKMNIWSTSSSICLLRYHHNHDTKSYK